MGSPSEKLSVPERRISTRNSVRISVHDGDEDADLAAMGMVADGFRPTQLEQPPAPAPSTPSLASSSATVLGDESPDSPSRKGRPASISKPHKPQDSLTLRRDGGMEQIPEPEALSRQMSGSTNSTAYLPAESPYQGPSGPSHPYQMYPQNVRMARTMSTTTASTVPISESSYSGPRGPSHPYGMYPQSDGAEIGSGQDHSIPLGFHGLPDQYQRRIGPDGEEAADLIGPDGHTEQLPPYSRYPEESYVRKVGAVEDTNHPTQQGALPATATPVATATTTPPPAAAAAAALVPLTIVAPAVAPPATQLAPDVAVTSGAGGIGLATRNPEFDSTDDLGSPQSRHSSRSFTSDSTQSQNGLQPFQDGMTEKGKRLKPWQIWMRRKLWGIIPYWALCMTGLILLLMGIILGSVIGTFLTRQKKPRKPWSFQTSPVPTATFGAIPIRPPPDLQPLPTGIFTMALMAGRELRTCFQDTTLSQAWNCFLVMGINLTVTQENAAYNVTLTSNSSLSLANHVYSYGEQPPRVEEPVTLELVNDTFEMARGPAWYKLLQYDKVVIIPEASLNFSATSAIPGKQIRRLAGLSDFKRKGLRRGDKPWVCTWPDIYLELFIYPQQNSSWSGYTPGGVGGGGGMGGPKPTGGYGGPSPTRTSSGSTTMTEPPGFPPPPSSSSSTASLTSADPPQTSPPPSLQDNSQQDYKQKPQQHQNSEQNRSDGSFPEAKRYNDVPFNSKAHGHEARSVGDNHEGTPTESSSATSSPTFGTIDMGDNYPPLPPFFPRVIKLGERRVYAPGGRAPECRQVEIQGYGLEAKPILDHKGDPVTIKIIENEPHAPPSHGPGSGSGSNSDPSSPSKRSEGLAWGDESQLLSREAFADMSPCGCMWWLT